MSKKWTIDSARAYITKVQKGRQQPGLTYCSAIDYLANHCDIKTNLHPLAEKENDNKPIN